MRRLTPAAWMISSLVLTGSALTAGPTACDTLSQADAEKLLGGPVGRR